MPSWPFVSRASELAVAQRAFTRLSAGVVVVGDAGVGKTRLAAELAAHLDSERHHVVHACASSASSGIPFGALSHLLPAKVGDLTEPGNMLGWAGNALLAAAAGRSLVLGIDDAHMLDGTSAALVDSLVRSGKAALLATVRAGEDVNPTVSGLWKDDLVTRLDLAPLSEDGVGEVLAAALAGPVSPRVVRRLARLSAGNVLYLRELVREAGTDGTLCRIDGTWDLRGEPRIAPRLRELIGARIGTLHGAARDAIELVAFGEPIGVDLLVAGSSQAAVESLEAKQLIHVVGDGRRCNVRLAHPLYTEAVRAACPASRGRRRLRQLAAAVESAGARRREDAIRVSMWRLDAGLPAEPGPLIEACHLAWAAQDLRLALRFARAALDTGGGSEAVAALSLLLNTIEDYDEAETIAASGPRSHGERGHALHATARATNLMWGLGREEDALRVLDAAASKVRTRVWRQQLTVARACVNLLRGDAEPALAMVRRLREAGASSPRVAAEAALVESFALTHSGRALQGADVAAAQLAAAASWREQAPHAEIGMHLSQFLAHALAGEVLLAERVATVAHDAAVAAGGWDMVIALFGGLRGQASRLRGNPAPGMRRCRESQAWLSRRGVVAGFCFAELSLCAAYAGEPAVARDALAEAVSRTPRVARMLDITTRIARPWVRAAEGDVASAISGMLDLARWMRRRRLPANETQVLHDVVRLGGAGHAAERLAALANVVEGDFPTLAARHAAGCVEGDGDLLEKVADEFTDIGMAGYAAEAAAHAAAAYRLAGRPRQRSAEAKAWLLLRRCEGLRTPALRALRAPDLTGREWEIAMLAARGLTSKEIAEQLVLSPRTVDNHLSSVYRKLDVNSRAELADIIGVSTSDSSTVR